MEANIAPFVKAISYPSFEPAYQPLRVFYHQGKFFARIKFIDYVYYYIGR